MYKHIIREIAWIFLGAFFYLLMFTAAAVVLAVCYQKAFSAPRPVHKEKPPPVIAAGKWVMKWNSVSSEVTLDVNGSYKCLYCGSMWYGSWSWDAKTRTMYVHEKMDDSHEWLYWSVPLDKDLIGKGHLGRWDVPDSASRELDISFSPAKKP